MRILRLSCLAALLVCVLASRAFAQYLYMDTNGDGVWTSDDRLNPDTTTVRVWLDTNHDRDGSTRVCNDHTGAASSTTSLNAFSYDLILHADGGTLWQDEPMDPPFIAVHAPGPFSFESEYDWHVRGTVSAVAEQPSPPGNQGWILRLYPNPSAALVRVRAIVPSSGTVRLEIYSVGGRRVDTSVAMESTVNNVITFVVDVSHVSSGIYFVKYLDVGKGVIRGTRRMAVIR